MIHQIQLGKNTDCPLALRVDLPGKLQGFRIHKVNICWGNSKNDTIGLSDILGYQIPGLFLDICWLISDWDLCLQT